MVGAYYSGTIKEFLENFKNAGEFVNHMKKHYYEKNDRSNVFSKQEEAWEESYEHIRKLFELLSQKGYGDIHCFFEYVLPGINERIDVVLMCKETKNIQDKSQDEVRLIIFELKGWKDAGENTIDAINQLNGYIEKLKHFHSFPQKYKCNFVGILWFYNFSSVSGFSCSPKAQQGTTTEESNFCLCYGKVYEDLARKLSEELLSKCECTIEKLLVEEFTKGSYAQSPKLIDMISGGLLSMLTCGISSLASMGYSPTEEQRKILEEIMQSLEKGERKCFIIEGGPGSGKTYLAILIAIEAIRRGWKLVNENENLVALVYRNDRMVKTFRKIFSFLGTLYKVRIDSFVMYYINILKENAQEDKNSKKDEKRFKLLICDEAQRIGGETTKSAKDAIKRIIERSDICVFLYDENQILLPTEIGTRENFLDAVKDLNYEEKKLTGSYRALAGKEYYDFVEDLLSGKINRPVGSFKNYELYLFSNINEMILKLVDKRKEKYKVAIVASLTEKNKKNKNLRAGKGINLDVYKSTDFKVYWLHKKKYPDYWVLNPEEMICNRNIVYCSSVYGCQGFEADYVGVIWGRDMVWRGDWDLGDNCEDVVPEKGENKGETLETLKDLFERAKKGVDINAKTKALKLLKNRYRIFLTRGIMGTYIFCEDKETRDYLSKIIPNIR